MEIEEVMMLVHDVMSAPVVSVGPSTSIRDAARLMLMRRISGLPVVKTDGSIVGIVSEGDFLRRKELGTELQRPRWLEFLVGPGKAADEYVHTHGRKVEEVMSENVVTAEPTTPLESVIETMTKHRIKRVPVIVESRVVGIVTRSDILQKLANLLPSPNQNLVADAEIEQAVVAELAAKRGAAMVI
jgi:CBS domain-containing protein